MDLLTFTNTLQICPITFTCMFTHCMCKHARHWTTTSIHIYYHCKPMQLTGGSWNLSLVIWLMASCSRPEQYLQACANFFQNQYEGQLLPILLQSHQDAVHAGAVSFLVSVCMEYIASVYSRWWPISSWHTTRGMCSLGTVTLVISASWLAYLKINLSRTWCQIWQDRMSNLAEIC